MEDEYNYLRQMMYDVGDELDKYRYKIKRVSILIHINVFF